MCLFYVCITDVLRAFKILKCIEEPIFQFTKNGQFSFGNSKYVENKHYLSVSYYN